MLFDLRDILFYQSTIVKYVDSQVFLTISKKAVNNYKDKPLCKSITSLEKIPQDK